MAATARTTMVKLAKAGSVGALALVVGLLLTGPRVVSGQPTSNPSAATPGPARPAPAVSSDTQAATGSAGAHGTPAAHAAAADQAAPGGDHGAPTPAHGAEPTHGTGEAAHGESIWATLARIANFAILAGILYWFGRKPLADHLAARRTQIRKELVDAAETRTTATARLADIEAKLAALPADLERLRARSQQDLDAERSRIRAAAEAERDRLVEQARREITSQTRTARAQLRAHAAALAVDVAEARLRGTLSPAEQAALVDQYASQMRNVQ